MSVTLSGNDSVTLTVEAPSVLRGVPILFVEASALRNPRGARVYVEVYLEGADGREHELGNFTFFGEIGDAGRRVFAFPMDDLTSEVAHVRASMNPFDANNGDVSDVRVDLQAWIGMR